VVELIFEGYGEVASYLGWRMVVPWWFSGGSWWLFSAVNSGGSSKAQASMGWGRRRERELNTYLSEFILLG